MERAAEFGAWVRDCRKRLGLTQREIAVAMRKQGCSWPADTVSALENGYRRWPLTLHETCALAEVLGTTSIEILAVFRSTHEMPDEVERERLRAEAHRFNVLLRRALDKESAAL